MAIPTSTQWHQVKTGAFICSNEGSADWYLFQCTELVNRLLYERWALPHLPGNAARYYDYYQDGVLHPGTIRTFPAGSYQLSDDASQGKSAFRPVAGDLLIFQDVNDSQAGWTSGLTNSPGHVAVIVGVDNTSVYVAQENYSDTQYFLACPSTRLPWLRDHRPERLEPAHCPGLDSLHRQWWFTADEVNSPRRLKRSSAMIS
jgi:hypothetical protein